MSGVDVWHKKSSSCEDFIYNIKLSINIHYYHNLVVTQAYCLMSYMKYEYCKIQLIVQ